jgi:hypothetical protein
MCAQQDGGKRRREGQEAGNADAAGKRAKLEWLPGFKKVWSVHTDEDPSRDTYGKKYYYNHVRGVEGGDGAAGGVRRSIVGRVPVWACSCCVARVGGPTGWAYPRAAKRVRACPSQHPALGLSLRL